MVSLAEKMAANMDMSAFSKAEELKKRLWFTVLALIVFRLGTFIPLPGIDPHILSDIFARQSSGILGMFNMFSGGALERMTIFALNIMPYISASIILQLGQSVIPSLAALKKDGEAGHRKITHYTKILTVFITIIQGYGIAVGLEGMTGSAGLSAVVMPGFIFKFTTIVSLVGGTMFIVWLGEQITSRGVGNGSSLIITVGIIANIPSALAQTFELGRVGSMSLGVIAMLLFMVLALIYIIVLVERAQRKITIQYPKRQMGGRMMSSENSHLPLKINPTGVIPPIFASSLLLLPITVANLSAENGPEWVQTLSQLLGPARHNGALIAHQQHPGGQGLGQRFPRGVCHHQKLCLGALCPLFCLHTCTVQGLGQQGHLLSQQGRRGGVCLLRDALRQCAAALPLPLFFLFLLQLHSVLSTCCSLSYRSRSGA